MALHLDQNQAAAMILPPKISIDTAEANGIKLAQFDDGRLWQDSMSLMRSRKISLKKDELSMKQKVEKLTTNFLDRKSEAKEPLLKAARSMFP